MAITVNIYYKGQNGSARKFAEEMVRTGTVDKIRAKEGNLYHEMIRRHLWTSDFTKIV